MTDAQPSNLVLEQINLSYDLWQDRLILRLRTRDSSLADLALTRRLTKNLLPALVKLLGGTVLAPDEAMRQELLAYEHQKTVGASDFAKPFNEDGTSLFEGGLVLVSEVKLHVLTANQGWRLEFLDRAGKGMNLNADKHMLHNLIKLFNDSLPSTGWDLPPAQIEGAKISEGHVMH
jgi:hypothetical protein